MSRAVCTFVDKASGETAEVIEFDLIDNPGVRAWQYAVMLNNKSRYLFRGRPIIFKKIRPTNIELRYEFLKSTVAKLSTTEFAWNHPVPELFDQIDQEFLNLAHRHFTNGCLTLWDPRQPRAYNPELDRILHDLNDIIHELELYVPTPAKLKHYLTGNEIRLTNDGRELGYDILPFKQYHSYEPADLILDGYILGKTLMESFACNDDPTSWDTAGHVRTNGGAQIMLDRTRQEIYDTVEFNQWLQDHGLAKHQTWADFPLGNFVPGHLAKAESVYKDLDKYSAHVNIKL